MKGKQLARINIAKAQAEMGTETMELFRNKGPSNEAFTFAGPFEINVNR